MPAMLLFAFIFALLVPRSVFATTLPKPTGPVILTVTGAITRTTDGNRAVFDRAQLSSLGIARVRTSTPWTDGVMEFEGVPVRVVLQALGARGKTLHAVAINDYAINLDAEEFEKVPAILALRMNGTDLRVRDKGPLWLVFPRDDFPAYRSDAHNFKWIWQLKTIDVR